MSDRPTTADAFRRAFIDFFVARGHTEVPSASVIPVDKSVMFTIAGMIPFKSYFVGEETPPFKRATSSQKCVRAGGKHNDLDDIGRTEADMGVLELDPRRERQRQIAAVRGQVARTGHQR